MTFHDQPNGLVLSKLWSVQMQEVDGQEVCYGSYGISLEVGLQLCSPQTSRSCLLDGDLIFRTLRTLPLIQMGRILPWLSTSSSTSTG